MASPSVNKITLTKVQVEDHSREGKYDIYVQWKMDTPPASEANQSSFYLVLKETNSSHSFHRLDRVKSCSGEWCAKEVSLLESSNYSIGVSTTNTEGSILSLYSIPVTSAKYKNIFVEYDGRNIILSFQPPLDISFGEITMKPYRDYLSSLQYLKINPYSTKARVVCLVSEEYELENERTHFVKSEIMTFSFRAVKDKNSLGPPTTGLVLFTDIPQLKSVEKEGNGFRIQCRLSDTINQYKFAVSIYLKAALWRGGQEIWQSDLQMLEALKTPEITFLASTTNPLPSCLDDCSLAVYVCTSGTTNKAMALDPVELRFLRPRVHFKGKCATVTWEGKPWEEYRMKVGEQPATVVTGCSHNIVISSLSDGCSVSVAAVSKDNVIGPYSEEVSLFSPGYYPSKTDEKSWLGLYLDDHSQEQVKLHAGYNLLSQIPGQAAETTPATPAAPETNSPFKLEKKADDDNSYLLSITKKEDGMISLDDFENFLTRQFQAGLTVEGYYRVRQLVARCGYFDQDQTLGFLNGLKRDKRIMDIFPGVCLRIETANYQPRLSDTVDDRGYIRASTEEYWVSLGLEGETSVLSYNGNLEKVMGGWNESTVGGGNTLSGIEPTGDGGWDKSMAGGGDTLPGIGGLMDFFCNSVRKPYARIYYPEAFHPSQKSSTYYATDNIIIAVSGDYLKLPAAIEGLYSSGLKFMVLRGRSTLTLSIPILVDGQQEMVPLGTTLGDLVSRMGIPTAAGRVRLWRETGCQDTTGPLEVRFDWLDDKYFADKLSLMPGDRVQLRCQSK